MVGTVGGHAEGVRVRRYTALRELIPSKDKADKATILMQVVDYIRQIQVCAWCS